MNNNWLLLSATNLIEANTLINSHKKLVKILHNSLFQENALIKQTLLLIFVLFRKGFQSKGFSWFFELHKH